MTTNIDAFCEQSLAETPIWQHMHRILHIQGVLRSGLPPDYQDLVRVANVRDNILIVAVANSALSTRIRFLSPTLYGHFKKHNIDIQQIRCQVSTSLCRQGR